MILTDNDLEELQTLATRIKAEGGGDPVRPLRDIFGPLLYPILACGFDEIRVEPIEAVKELNSEFLRWTTDNPHIQYSRNEFRSPFVRQAFRKATGLWYRFDGVDFGHGGIVLCQGTPLEPVESPVLTVQDILEGCEASLHSPSEFGAVVLPNLWKPQKYPSIDIVESLRVHSPPLAASVEWVDE